jgi:hypothetical protein
MGSLLVVIFVAALAFVWARGLRTNRRRWLERVGLPGAWHSTTEAGDEILELTGELDNGGYLERSPFGTDRGRWLLRGHTLVLVRDDGQSVELDLRLFDEGKIGLDGPGHERRVYTRAESNVVPLRRRG